MLKNMNFGSVIVDVAVDQGGCVESCKPTTHNEPTYIVDDIVHYCVSNMPGSVPHTSTLALTNITLPYIETLSNYGLKNSLLNDQSLLKGLNIHQGRICHQGVAKSFDLNYHDSLSLFS